MDENFLDQSSSGETTTPPTTITTNEVASDPVADSETTTPPSTVTELAAAPVSVDETTTPPHPAETTEVQRPDLSGYQEVQPKTAQEGSTPASDPAEGTTPPHPAAIYEEVAILDGAHGFGIALQLLQSGHRIKRISWGNRHLVLNTTNMVNDFIQDVREGEAGANGYNCNQHDILAHDWVVVD